MRGFIGVFIAFIFISFSSSLKAETYVTWTTMEPDKCASAWLIKRFVDKKAIFKFIPKGEFVTGGMPFDTPDSEFRRYHNMSTFESILEKCQIKDPALIHIGKIMHDLEINYWREKSMPESQQVQDEIQTIISTTKNASECFSKTFPILDRIYSQIKSRKLQGHLFR